MPRCMTFTQLHFGVVRCRNRFTKSQRHLMLHALFAVWRVFRIVCDRLRQCVPHTLCAGLEGVLQQRDGSENQ